jgi:adenylate cyclase
MQGQVMALTRLAEVYARDGQVEAGRHILTEVLDLIHSSGLRLWDPEVYRLRGTLLLAPGAPEHTTTSACVEEAVACLQQALVVARQRQARALELRAATSLARLRQQQDQRTEVRAVLAPVYGWFTEGFDTADLQEARALLDELGA